MTNQITYIDGLGRVRIANGMAHIELVAAFPSQDKTEDKVDVRAVQNLVIPLAQFVRFCGDMAANLKHMEDKGIITRKEPVPTPEQVL